MPGTLHQFLATATRKAAADLEAAYLRLPEDKRNWSPMGKARTAADVVAECAMLNGSTVEMIGTRAFPDFDQSQYERERDALIQDQAALLALLKENTEKVIEALPSVADEDLGNEIPMPWGAVTVAELIAYPYWNMSYHEAQINYIASMLGCLD